MHIHELYISDMPLYISYTQIKLVYISDILSHQLSYFHFSICVGTRVWDVDGNEYFDFLSGGLFLLFC